MEVCFDLIIPKIISDDEFHFSEELINWGGEMLSQDPPKYTWNDLVSFTKKQMPEHIRNYIPRNIDVSEWFYLSLDEGSLSEWGKSVNDDSKISEAPLKEFLIQLLKRLDQWVLVFEINCDQIDGVYQLNAVDLLSKIENSLNWHNDPEGFVAWNKVQQKYGASTNN